VKPSLYALAWSTVLAVSFPSLTAAQWAPDGRALCDAPNAQSTPIAVPDGLGGGIVVWRDTRNAGTTGSDIFATRVTKAGGVAVWPNNGVALCLANGDQLEPEATTDGAGGAIATWQDFRLGAVGDIFAGRVQADGLLPTSWPTNGVAICTASGSQTTPVIAPDNAGGAFIRGKTSEMEPTTTYLCNTFFRLGRSIRSGRSTA